MAGEHTESPLIPEPAAVQVYTLGGFRVVVGGSVIEDHAWRRRTARQLFKLLLTRPGRRITRDEVVELFWPDSDPEAASSNLRSTLYAIRRALQPANRAHRPEVIFSDQRSVWLGEQTVLWSDAADFEQKIAEAWRSPDPLPRLREASALYAGDYLPDDLYEDWAGERRDALRRTWTELQFGLVRALEAHSDVNAALQSLERLLRADPCNERAAQEQMKLLTRHGGRAQALRVYQRLVRSLREELDVEPSAETVELQHLISTGEAVASLPVPAAAFRCTYPFPTPAELIDREAELTTLRRVVTGGLTAGTAALIAAPAGTGKSALVGHLVRQAQAQGVLCLAGGCYEERGAVPLGPFHDALVDYLLAQPPDSVLMQLGASADDLTRVVPELRYHLKLSPQGLQPEVTTVDRTRAFGAIHACLRSLAQQGPVLMCLEDLHAADEGTLELLHYLARQTRRLPLVLLATYRSDEAQADQLLSQTVAAMVRERLAQHVILNALDRAETIRLATVLLEGSPSSSLSESLFGTTGGNPLFVEQLVLGLREAGQLAHKGGEWYGVGERQSTPQIVHEVIAQRLQRLDPSCRQLLAMASVLGQSFEHKVLLAAVEPLDESTLLRDVDRAISAQILQDTAGGYAFRHVLVRDAVYWDLSAPRRMLLHARAADLLEQLYGARANDYAAELAHHFVHAGAAAQIRARALHYSLEAGRRAAALSSNREALEHFSRALHLVDADTNTQMAARLQALEGRGFAERGLGLLPEAVASLRAVLDLTDEPIRRARVRGEIANALLHNDPEGALAEVKAAAVELEQIREDAAAAAVRLRLQSFEAMYRFLAGQYGKVLAIGEEMLPVATSLGDVIALCRPQAVFSWAHIGAGRVSDAVRHSELLLALAEDSQDKSEVAMAEVNLGLECYLGGEFANARDHVDRARSLYLESGNDVWLSNTLQLSARLLLAQGDLHGARVQAESALAVAHGQQERWTAEAYDVLGNVYLLTAEHNAAESSFESALAIRRRIGHATGVIDSLVALGRLYTRIGNWENAERLYGEALHVAQGIDLSPSVVAAWRQLGRLYCRMREFERAASYLERAVELARGVSETIEYAPTLLAISELEALTGKWDAAVERVDQALERGGTVEFRIEANAAAANTLRDSERRDDAVRASALALELAEHFGAPFLLGTAHLGAARVSVVRQDRTAAMHHYTAALQSFVSSGVVERDETEREIAELTRNLPNQTQGHPGP